MRFKDVFSIIGPAMVGPSSSHTAGAVRIGRVARHILGDLPEKADILFYGSFADTYRGHGTDLAIVGGLLDFDTDDSRIPSSLAIAEQLGITIAFKEGKGQFPHPNTAKVMLRCGEREVIVTGASIGGGNIEVLGVNEFDVKFTAMYPTLILFHNDRPGMIADVTRVLSRENVNIGHMSVDRKGRSGEALTVIDTDSSLTEELIREIAQLATVRDVRLVDLTANRGSDAP
ncbi:L-serine ammonia-lyase, iron-sulfur-dependent, subunit beta [Paenibacillus mesophilus]|uniref:L-serine ammonia-lyase, iron-sulfur-dependent subunit beta n=1 Tax=Paenibacillus mesophilus TaxID=2582849 RepID=UPI00110D8C8F|nr:L-serine ammonia-lyase, iron-sulfur-dependent subunit beta [Paenibacillus mesophilus]TMV44179.1 L-serine ammonia-lyase, iron-sulfur-dependent, subunit beta [Paenibacillus mesophilus]